jgi:UDP-N-acetylmuramyl tripeptide synthase
MTDDEARRITGPHPLLPGTGVGVELGLLPGVPNEARVAAVLARLRAIVDTLGLPMGEPVVRAHASGASILVPVPPDVLYPATYVLDAAVAGDHPDCEPWSVLAQRFRDDEQPALRALYARAEELGVPHFHDEDGFTFGFGKSGRTWPLTALPAPEDLAGPEARVPFAVVTGTNGKTTTTRLLSRIGREAGRVTGHTSSDGIVLQGETIEEGDWTGPGAARTLLRRPELELAVLETARGGLLRRGLVATGADVAVLTNVSADHLGEWGLHTVEDLAWAKAALAAEVRPGGVIVANAGCAPLWEAARGHQKPGVALWGFAAEPGPGLAGWLDGDDLWVAVAGPPRRLLGAADVPIAFGGTARYNLENALAAALGAFALGLSEAAVLAGLRGFRPSVAESKGRANRFHLPDGGFALLDFAHNPDGVRQLGAIVAALPRVPLRVVVGAAGDRTDAALVELAEAVASLTPDQVILKDLPDHFRGRGVGEVPAVIRAGLLAACVPREAVREELDEVRACAVAVEGLPRGGLALLLVHERVDEVLAMLAGRGAVEG